MTEQELLSIVSCLGWFNIAGCAIGMILALTLLTILYRRLRLNFILVFIAATLLDLAYFVSSSRLQAHMPTLTQSGYLREYALNSLLYAVALTVNLVALGLALRFVIRKMRANQPLEATGVPPGPQR